VRGVSALASALFLLSAPAIFEVFNPSGIAFRQESSPTAAKHLIETMGGGVAILDYNNDGLADLFFVNGGHIGGAGFNRDNPKYWNRLYRQNRNGTFTDVTAEAGLSRAGEGNYGMGVAVADYDNDGYPDLYVTSFGHNVLYHNNGNGTFTDVTAKAGVAVGGWSASAGFFDFDNDGKLDLLVTRYMDWSLATSKSCAKQTYCPPGEFPAVTNVLYRNRGDGTFEDVSQKSGIAGKKGRSLGVAFGDYDNDGFPDIFVANDGMEEFLWHNNGNGTFTERALDAGVALSDDGKPYAGMGVDFRDYDNDGKPDIIVTNLAKQTYALYHNDGNGSFSYRSLQSGLGILTAGSSGWGVGLVDFDNDGWKDLFVAQGHVMDNVEQIDASMHYLEPPLMALNHLGRFEKADAGVATPVAGRGAAFGDLNNDGKMDVVMGVLNGKPLILRNQAFNNNHWLGLRLEGVRSNRDGLGATIIANGQTQYLQTAGSYQSANDKRVHFGLGDKKLADIQIRWPSGVLQKLANIPADQYLDVKEPAR
jgi:hypothetical protein